MSRGPSFGGRELALAACVLGAALLSLLWRPLVGVDSHVFSPTDVATQACTLTRVEHGYTRANALLTDPALEMQPWLVFNQRELAAGRAPLWNPLNGCGVPHLANYQSAPFSLFSLPFYVLPFDVALLVASFAKLFALALFTYLFLHQIGLQRFAAWCGAFASATSGFALLLHQYPHVGAMLAVPGGLYFAERVLQDLEDGRERPSLVSLACLSAVLVVAAYAGHPETLAYGTAVLAAYCAWRAYGLWCSSVPRARTIRACVALVVAGVIAAGLAAPQLVPFVEYLAESRTVAEARGADLPLARENWPLLLYPDLAGTPLGNASLDAGLPAPNYEEFNSFHVGGLVLLAAALAVWPARRDRRVVFFAALVSVWALYAWNAFGLATWLAQHTPLGHVPIHRTHPLALISLSTLAAFTIDRWERHTDRSASWRATCTFAVGVATLALFLWGADRYVESTPSPLRTDRWRLLELIDDHVLRVSCVFMGGVCGLALLTFTRPRAIRWLGRVAVFAALWMGGNEFSDYTPVVPKRFLHPRTPGIESLRATVGDQRWLALSGDTLPANFNLVYDLALIANRDALHVRRYEELFEHFFGGSPSVFASRRGLELFGVRHVATKSTWVPIETELSDVMLQRHNATVYLLSEIQQERQSRALVWVPPSKPWRFDFVATRDDFDRLCVHLRDELESRGALVTARLFERESGVLLAERECSFDELHALPDLRRELIVACEPQRYSCDRAYTLELATQGARVKVVLGGLGKGFRPLAPQTLEDRGPALDVGYGERDFELVGRAADFHLSRFTNSRGEAWVVANADVAGTPREAFELVKARDFEPYERVVLEEGSELRSAVELATTVTELERTPQRRNFLIASSHAGYCVIAQTFFPGWRARVDGIDAPILRANYAFSAVAVPAGEHTLELEYAPRSFAIGVALAVLSAAAGIVFGFVQRRSA